MTGAGQNTFVGGGVLVNVGHQQQTAFVCLVRAGYGMTALGAGVFIHIAELENRAWGAAAIFGAGQVYSNGAGILDKTGGEVVNSAISAFQALVGGSAYVNSVYPPFFLVFFCLQRRLGCALSRVTMCNGLCVGE